MRVEKRGNWRGYLRLRNSLMPSTSVTYWNPPSMSSAASLMVVAVLQVDLLPDRAGGHAGAAAGALGRVHAPRLLEDAHAEAARLALEALHLRVGVHRDVGVPRGLHELGRHDAHPKEP